MKKALYLAGTFAAAVIGESTAETFVKRQNQSIEQAHLLAVKTAISSSSSSRGRYAVYDYDLTTPQYTPDGRLLQVEYATNACRGDKGGEGRNPIVCVGMSIPSQRDVLLYNTRRLQNQKRRKQQQQQLNESGGQRKSELECTDNDGDDDSFTEVSGDALLIMATISSPPPSSSTSLMVDSKHKTDGNNKEKQSSSSTTEQQSNYINQQRTQCRIIEVPLSTSFQTQYYGKTSSTTTTESTSILIGLSGILADATALLQIAYSVLEEEQISFGWHRLGLSPVGTTTVAVDSNCIDDYYDVNVNAVTKSHVHPRRQQQQQQTAAAAQPSETTVRLARAIGDKCQKHAFGGGLRPLGASLMIAGIEQQQQKGGSGSSIKLAMCETEPSGAVSVINPFWVTPTTSTTSSSAEGAENKLVINSPRVMVSGGATKSQSKLKQTMTLRTRDLYDDIIVNSEKDEARGRVIYSEEIFLRRALQTVIEALVEEWKGRGSIPSLSGDNSKREQPMVLPQMEVVFTTPKRGTFRLSENDIRVLMESTEK